MCWECIIVKGGENYNFLCVKNYNFLCVITVHCISKAYIKWTFTIVHVYILLLVFKYVSLWNSLSVVFYSMSVVFSLKHVKCSQIRLNGDIPFITFRVHVYKIL